MKKIVGLCLLSANLLLLSCNKGAVEPFSISAEEIKSGGGNTVFNTSQNAFAQPNPDLSGDEELLFFVGNSFFNQNWVSSPASTKARDGLGPLFNARSCSGCHFKDGRGEPLQVNQANSKGFLMRMSINGTDAHGGPNPHPIYGDQLNENSVVLNDPAEGRVEVVWEYITKTYADGTTKELRKPIYTVYDASGNEITNTNFSPRVGQQVIGLGLLEAIAESDLHALTTAYEDLGISGKINYVYNHETGTTEVGRFGWKANQPSIRQQVAGAFVGDMGITSPIFSQQNNTAGQTQYDTLAHGGNPEIETDDFDKVVLYCSNLAVPARRDTDTDEVKKGQQLFNEIGCVGCHNPKFTTTTHEDFPYLGNQTIYPYTDMLLHDMGEGLADHRTDYLANGTEWRTQPLWGLGLIERVNGHSFLLHDGRARNIEEAILWHGGEASIVLEKFMELNAEDRAAVLAFLQSL
ncbi:di-heme oxidoredictase family protein [Lishizhenia sp.]|uniref:di-heme oxidoreductase family protein n=1 Tax=Lishizhenia sp. TaxID=2497594 RepID=UPI00299D7A8D|nr:di-heme oxidoredictase family protein [Lishizhenia sp.]MDX1446976.1 di-heme oxidoredictase family protein [Lishizhenia sp.]